MSGGSYNYLFSRFPEDMLSSTTDLREMVERLEGIAGAEDAAADARLLLMTILQAKRDVEVWQKRLSDVFHAVEWRDSCDWGDDQMLEVVTAYESAVTPPKHMHRTPDA